MAPDDRGDAPARVRRVLHEELGALDPRALAGRALVAVLPAGVGNRMRVRVLRAVGFRIGHGTTLAAGFSLLGGKRARTNVSIGARCFINQGCVFDASAPIEIGDDVAIGHQVLLTTSGHRMDQAVRRAGALAPEPIRVGRGAWLASRVVVLPGVTVGNGAVVCAGAVVARSVPDNAMVGGVPAKLIRMLDDR